MARFERPLAGRAAGRTVSLGGRCPTSPRLEPGHGVPPSGVSQPGAHWFRDLDVVQCLTPPPETQYNSSIPDSVQQATAPQPGIRHHPDARQPPARAHPSHPVDPAPFTSQGSYHMLAALYRQAIGVFRPRRADAIEPWHSWHKPTGWRNGPRRSGNEPACRSHAAGRRTSQTATAPRIRATRTSAAPSMPWKAQNRPAAW